MPSGTARQVGQLLFGSFPGLTVSQELRSLAREFDLGGVVLFRRNVEAPEQIFELASDCEALGREMPAWVSIDQEGGRVARLTAPFTTWPPMASLGRAQSEELAGRFGRALGRELKAVGITLDYAPVLDVHTNPKNPIIGDRAFGENADEVARLGRAVIRALQEEGVAACGKHFPGHGDTSSDSHLELPLVEHPPDRLQAVELVPFKAAVAERVAFIMTAHVLIPALDEQRPATLSPMLVQGLLREELGFEGVILSDDLEMQAISRTTPLPDAAVQAISAGCDAVLVCQGDIDRQAATLEALVTAVENHSIPPARFAATLKRLKDAKGRFLAAPRAKASERVKELRTLVGHDDHQRVAAEMAAWL